MLLGFRFSEEFFCSLMLFRVFGMFFFGDADLLLGSVLAIDNSFSLLVFEFFLE